MPGEDILDRIVIRPLSGSDSLKELTLLLNKAYQKLTDQGFKFLASYQDEKITKARLKNSQCFVAILDNRIVGTITLYTKKRSSWHEWYKKPFVAKFAQLAVEPSLQGVGLGGRLVDFVESLAKKEGFKEIAIDTAEGATDLVRYYHKRSYRPVAYGQWNETNYRSVILSKQL